MLKKSSTKVQLRKKRTRTLMFPKILDLEMKNRTLSIPQIMAIIVRVNKVMRVKTVRILL